jgi:hypothetical protein
MNENRGGWLHNQPKEPYKTNYEHLLTQPYQAHLESPREVKKDRKE